MSGEDTPSSVFEEVPTSSGATGSEPSTAIPAKIESPIVDPVQTTSRAASVKVETSSSVPERVTTGLGEAVGGPSAAVLARTSSAVADPGQGVLRRTVSEGEIPRVVERTAARATPAATSPFTSVVATSEGPMAAPVAMGGYGSAFGEDRDVDSVVQHS